MYLVLKIEHFSLNEFCKILESERITSMSFTVGTPILSIMKIRCENLSVFFVDLLNQNISKIDFYFSNKNKNSRIKIRIKINFYFDFSNKNKNRIKFCILFFKI